MKSFDELMKLEIFHLGKYILTVNEIFSVALTIVITLFILWVFRRLFLNRKSKERFDRSNLYSLYQITKYLIWIISVFFILDILGIKINMLLAGSAALLVGIGLGLQNTFNNFISGIIILFEGSIKVGDILELDGDVVKMQRIGLRTSSAINRDDIVVIIPNSIITTNKVINWSHQEEKTRFRIKVGVAYGSDVDLVLNILKESAFEHPDVTDKTAISHRFVDFGSSSLDFEVLFFSNNIFRIESVKSEIRKIINRKFIENNITIPFTQLDIHIKPESSQPQG
ncbi:hypothetical protein SDC9_55751 [bioreactor metagenome]|uniref:Mechanosensitive channel MscK n=1 Tax=bioreactor metagenome TaxID=1076179 RepID=A0A644X5K8_9ZZZZ